MPRLLLSVAATPREGWQSEEEDAAPATMRGGEGTDARRGHGISARKGGAVAARRGNGAAR
uniref:DUF834 domain-containing protein n=1 Tax=Leersia perrieri TaxID=77586 RepID=A0A0D9WLY0_9ORYZ